ncbi:MAG: sigma-70 family RNA polymerase sigma factor, partial [Actinomycetota bacterium]|nr:sigma-70 family RNA polymerase sigma factor [Actinomycetota bacterium]
EGLALKVAEARPSGDAAPSPEAAAFAHEDHRVLVDALNRLPERDRQVLTYRYFLDLSEAEMAAAMKVARGTVKSRLARAQERLRASLPKEVRGDA